MMEGLLKRAVKSSRLAANTYQINAARGVAARPREAIKALSKYRTSPTKTSGRINSRFSSAKHMIELSYVICEVFREVGVDHKSCNIAESLFCLSHKTND
jgi:hypothetical protein